VGKRGMKRADLWTPQARLRRLAVRRGSPLAQMNRVDPEAETAFKRSLRAEQSSVSMLVGGTFIHRPSPSSSAAAIRSGSVAPGTRRMRSASNGVVVFALMIFRISPDSRVVS
jgi:hypothetical protein